MMYIWMSMDIPIVGLFCPYSRSLLTLERPGVCPRSESSRSKELYTYTRILYTYTRILFTYTRIWSES
jgi:hypothetical protein